MRRRGWRGLGERAAGRPRHATGAFFRRRDAAQRHRARRQVRLPELPRAQPWK